MVIGRDPVPEAVQRNIASAVANAEAQLALLEVGRLTRKELDLYVWSVEVVEPEGDPSSRRFIVTYRLRAGP